MTTCTARGIGFNTTAATTIAANGVSAAAGSVLLVWVAFDNLSATTPTVSSLALAGTNGSTWAASRTLLASVDSPVATAAGGVRGELWAMTANVALGSSTLTATLSGSVTVRTIQALEATGLTTNLAALVRVIGATVLSAPSLGSGTQVADELELMCWAGETNAQPTFASTNGWVATNNQGVNSASGGAAANVSNACQWAISTGAGSIGQAAGVTTTGDGGCFVISLSPVALTQVTSSRATTWRVLEQVTSSRATLWAVLSALTQVTSSRSTSWAVRAQVSSTRSTSWAVLASVSSSRSTSWAVLARVTSTRSTSWAVLSSGGRVAATLVAYGESSWDSTGATSLASSVAWQAGDRILVVGLTSDSGVTLGLPTVSGLTFANLGTNPTGGTNNCLAYTWEATAASSGSGQVQANRAGGTAPYGIAVFVERGSDGFSKVADVSTAKTISLPRAQDASRVVFAAGDWSAGAVTGFAFTPAGATTDEASRDAAATQYARFVADWPDQGAAGTTSYGITGTSSTGVHTKIAVEVLGTGGTALTQVTSSRSTSWATLAQTTSSRGTSWAVLASVTSSRVTSWAALAAVTSSRGTSWAVLARVSSTRSTTWAALAPVTSSRGTSWAVLAAVTSSRATLWAVLSALTQVTSSRSTSWAVRAQVSSTRSTSWAVLVSVSSSRSTLWAVLARVTSTRSTSWAVLASVSSTRSTTWRVLASVTSSRSTSWAVLGTLAQVTSSRSTSWAVFARVTSSRSTSWAVLARVSSTRSTSWAVLVSVSSSRATSWRVLASVTSSRSTLWAVAPAGEPDLPPSWRIRVVTGESRIRVVAGERRTLTVPRDLRTLTARPTE